MHRKVLSALAAAALASGAAACGSSPPAAAPPAGPGSTAPPAAVSPAAAPHSAGKAKAAASRSPAHHGGTLRVLAEPSAGIGPIYRLITGARQSVNLTMYELNDPAAEADLAHDAARGVDVRVLLDQHFEKSANAPAYAYLAAHHVHVRWAPAGTTYHQKTLTVDGTTSVVMTLNLVASDYPDTRDFAVIDTDHADVAAITATFDADFAGQAISPPDGADLVWSPTNAQAVVLQVIGGARHTLAVEDEEMDDPAVTSALAAAARRGVRVDITMTADDDWDSAFSQLAAAGAHVRLYADDSSALYIHAKAIVADAGRSGEKVLVGSQNFSVASLDYNRELGIVTTDRRVVSAISSALAADFAGGTPYSAPKAGTRPRCTATASVYDAGRNENNVYVHSDVPDQAATASADGYSHSYQTDGSGYALIYLNGPAPGARITVTVGGATCTTSD